MYNGDFENDLIEGEKTELEYVNILSNIYPIVKLAKENKKIEYRKDKYYDVKIPTLNGDMLIEIKDDERSNSTGNIAVEFENNLKPSGINVTKSQWWVTKHNNKFYVISVKKLKEKIKNNDYFRTAKCQDKDKYSQMYLFKAKQFIADCCAVIDETGCSKIK